MANQSSSFARAQAAAGGGGGGGTAAGVSDLSKHFWGDVPDYVGETSAVANEVQYTRVRLTKDQVIDRMELYFTSTASINSLVLGIYGQADPEDDAGIPAALPETTTGLVTMDGDEDGYTAIPLEDPYTVPATGWYWLACVFEAAMSLLCTDQMVGPAVSAYEETAADVELVEPDTLTQPDTAIIYLAAVEEAA